MLSRLSFDCCSCCGHNRPMQDQNARYEALMNAPWASSYIKQLKKTIWNFEIILSGKNTLLEWNTRTWILAKFWLRTVVELNNHVCCIINCLKFWGTCLNPNVKDQFLALVNSVHNGQHSHKQLAPVLWTSFCHTLYI